MRANADARPVAVGQERVDVGGSALWVDQPTVGVEGQWNCSPELRAAGQPSNADAHGSSFGNKRVADADGVGWASLDHMHRRAKANCFLVQYIETGEVVDFFGRHGCSRGWAGKIRADLFAELLRDFEVEGDFVSGPAQC